MTSGWRYERLAFLHDVRDGEYSLCIAILAASITIAPQAGMGRFIRQSAF